MREDGFYTFCRELVDRGISPHAISPERLADAFARHFHLSGFPQLEELRRLVKRARVGVVLPAHLPRRLRGVHFGLKDGGYVIHYNDADWKGSWPHTVLHEAYEILQEKFAQIVPSYAPPRYAGLCLRGAERFAAALLMRREMFRLFAQVSGLDVVALHRLYGRSYASVAIRMVEVADEIPFLVMLYERRDEGGATRWVEASVPGSFLLKVAAATRAFAQAGWRIPRKGTPPAPGSLAARVIESGSPVCAEVESGHGRKKRALVLVRPVKWWRRLAKVVMTAVPGDKGELLMPQVSAVSPHRIGTVRVSS